MAAQLSRRTAIMWMIGAMATLPGLTARTAAQAHRSQGIGIDPNLFSHQIPWDLVLKDQEMLLVTSLSDVIIPSDERSPSASQVGVPSFINEWVSAPYEQHVRDRKVILSGLLWLDKEAKRRYQKGFVTLQIEQKHAICDDICSTERARPKYQKASEFFDLFRDLTMGGFYTTPAGWQDIGYLGNVPLAKFDGPPPEVLKHLGLSE